MSINIILFNTDAYHPGQTVEGKVVCIFNSDMNIRGIRLKLIGREHTDWEKEESYTDDKNETRYRTVQYSGENTFLEYQETLVGQGSQNPGRYEYPYKFILPKILPGSYSGANGRIYYALKANVDIPMGFDHESEKIFFVRCPVDLNEIPKQLLSPIQLQDEKTICCWCCADGPITMDVYLERCAFVVGESIKLRIEVSNLANESLEQIKVGLKNVIVEKVNSPSIDRKSNETFLASEVETGVGAHGNRTYNFELRVPPDVEVPNFDTCQLFLHYCELKIEGTLPGPHTNMSIEQKLRLGHIPPRSLGNPPQPLYPSDQIPPYPTGANSNQPTGAGWVRPSNDAFAPSAPSKAELGDGYGYYGSGNASGTNIEPPPPSYNDVVKH